MKVKDLRNLLAGVDDDTDLYITLDYSGDTVNGLSVVIGYESQNIDFQIVKHGCMGYSECDVNITVSEKEESK